jgi:AcrR family transcriptional regulator
LAYGSIYQCFDSKDDLFDALMSAEGYALRTHVAVALAASGQRSDRSWAPLRAAVQATFEFFEKDKATAKLLLRDAYALGERFETHPNNIYESFIDDIDQLGRGFIVSLVMKGLRPHKTPGRVTEP